MKKIEEKMLQAVRTGGQMMMANTAVTQSGGVCRVFLHGNEIASGERLGPFGQDGGAALAVNVETLRRWPTVTTRSRLRALGFDVAMRRGVVHLDGKPLVG